MKRISIRIDDNIHSKLIDQANQQGLSLSESVRSYLEKQTNDKTPSYQDETSIKEQTSNENHPGEKQNTRDNLKDWIKKLTLESKIEHAINKRFKELEEQGRL